MEVDRKQLVITYAKRMLVDMIYSSANIEGLGTTFPTTECILEGLPTNCTSNEVLFILNMRDAYKFLFENIDYDNTLAFIRQLNSIVGDRLIYGCGQLRTVDVSIGGTKWKPSIPIEALVLDELSAIDREPNPLAKGLAFFCYLARAQLFIDGNKRVAQLMTNKVLIQNGVGILDVPKDCMSTFKRELINFYETGNAVSLCRLLVTECIQRL